MTNSIQLSEKKLKFVALLRVGRQFTKHAETDMFPMLALAKYRA